MVTDTRSRVTAGGRLDRLEGLYRRWIELEPERLDPYVALADVLVERGRGAEALELAQGHARANEERPDAWSRTGTVLQLAGFGEPACEAFRRASELDPSRGGLTIIG